MNQIRVYSTSINPRAIADAVSALRQGEPVIYPTDTVYALGCNALDNGAVERLCALRGVDPRKATLSVVCADIAMAAAYARIDNRAFRLLREYLPGPVTFVLPASTSLPKVFKGRRTVGVRIPACPVATMLAAELGNPLLSMSAIVDPDDPALSSEPDPVAVEYAAAVGLMLDSGSCGGGLSTVVDLTDSTQPEVIRQGLTPFTD